MYSFKITIFLFILIIVNLFIPSNGFLSLSLFIFYIYNMINYHIKQPLYKYLIPDEKVLEYSIENDNILIDNNAITTVNTDYNEL